MKPEYLEEAPQLAIPITRFPEHYDYNPEDYSEEDIANIKAREEMNRQFNQEDMDKVDPDKVSLTSATMYHSMFTKQIKMAKEATRRKLNAINKSIAKQFNVLFVFHHGEKK